MTLEEFKDVLQLNKLANSWVDDYNNNNLGAHSSSLKVQYKEMSQLKSKTNDLIKKQAGEVEIDTTDWKVSFETIYKLAKKIPAYANCFGKADQAYDNTSPTAQKVIQSAAEIKKMTATWYGTFAEEIKDSKATNLIATLHDHSKKILAGPKETTGEAISLVLYGSKNKRCSKMRRNVAFIGDMDQYNGTATFESQVIQDKDKVLHDLKLEKLPTIVFKRGGKEIAKHEGVLSISGVQQKLNVLLEGGNITNSSSVKSIHKMKEVNPKELYNLGEYVLFYFEAPKCGLCKEVSDVADHANLYNKVIFEKINIDGTHNKHKNFGISEVPTFVFIRDGKVIGKQIGDINDSKLEKLLEKFAISNKRNIGLKRYGEPTVIDQELLSKQKEAEDKKKK